MKLFTVNAKGYFQYNGSDVKPKLNDAWYTRGVLSIWQVSNWKAGTYKKVLITLKFMEGKFSFWT